MGMFGVSFGVLLWAKFVSCFGDLMRIFCLGLVFWRGHGELGNWLPDVGRVHFGFWHPHLEMANGLGFRCISG